MYPSIDTPHELPREFSVIVEQAVGTSPSTDRGRRTYSRVLEVASTEFVRADYKQVSVEHIAEKAEVSVGSIYRYFGSKEGLFMVVLARCLFIMNEASRSGANDSHSYREILRGSTTQYLLAYQRFRFVLGAAEHLGATSTRVRELTWVLQRLIRESMARGLERIKSESELPELPLETQLRALTSMVDGYARRAFIEGEFGDEARTAQSVESAAEVLSLIWFRSVMGSEPDR